MLEECFKKYRDLPAFVFMGKTLTFGQVDELSAAFGAYLHARGLEPGDRIALMMPMSLHNTRSLFLAHYGPDSFWSIPIRFYRGK